MYVPTKTPRVLCRYRSCYENECSQREGAIIEKSGNSHYYMIIILDDLSAHFILRHACLIR